MTAEEFWLDMGEFYKRTDDRRTVIGLTEVEEEMVERLYAVEMVRRAAEAEIREYNKLAREWNRRHGYKY